MKKVRLFSDWADSETLARNMWDRFVSFSSWAFTFGEVEFVWGDEFDYAVVFNFATDQLPEDFPASKVVGLVLEPQEILDVMYKGWRDFDTSKASTYYSFTPLNGFVTALGIGFPQASPHGGTPEWADRKLACMIASSKTFTPYQVHRRKVLTSLLRSDLEIDFYGRGMKAFGDERIKGEIPPGGKDPILDQYKYVIDFENSPWALTDKFFDPVLRGAVPITNSLTPQTLGLLRGYHWVEFDRTPADIARGIARFLERQSKGPSDYLVGEVWSGRLCLPNWIDEKVRGLA